MRSLMPVLHVLSLVILIFGLTMLLPVAVSWLLHDGAESVFDEAIALTLVTGVLLATICNSYGSPTTPLGSGLSVTKIGGPAGITSGVMV